MKNFTIVGNWKMNTLPSDAVELSAAIVRHMSTAAALANGHGVVLAPPLISLAAVHRQCIGSGVKVASQDCHAEETGAYTGDVSAAMVRAVGATHVIVGHSERRRYHGETDVMIGKKAAAAARCGLVPIICIGEVIEDRQAGITNTVLREQLEGILQGMGNQPVAHCMVAYEPVWAIGTGVAATPSQAQETHAYVRSVLDCSNGALRHAPILYGGSVTNANASELFSCESIDGALVGGASLDAEKFVAIIQAANSSGSSGV